jgi:hypothetical protein
VFKKVIITKADLPRLHFVTMGCAVREPAQEGKG